MGYLENQKTCEFALPPLGAWCRKELLARSSWGAGAENSCLHNFLVVLLKVKMTKGIGKKMESKCSLPVM
jgi:hypothetical protein